jgi:hypothetical protein
MGKRDGLELAILKNTMFFFDVLLALLIIVLAKYMIWGSQFAKLALFFGLGMLSLTVLLRLIKNW